MKSFKAISIILLCTGSLFGQTNSSDTVRMNYDKAKELFLKNNFLLLAQKYNIDIAGAAKKQASLWANPTVFAEINAYNPHTKQWFNTSRYVDPATGASNYGSYDIQLNQLIQTAGKRSKLIAMAETNVQLQEMAFEEFMRQMRFELFSSLSNLYLSQQTLQLLQDEQNRITELVKVEKFALEKGAVSGYEVTRLQFELQDLQSSINDYQNQVADNQMNLNQLFCNKTFVYYTAEELSGSAARTLNVLRLTDSAMNNRPDVKTALYTLKQNEINLRLQKATNVPDLLLGANYDRNGGAYLNYTGLNLSIPIPLFNQNQGNIQAARIQTLQAQSNQQYAEVQVKQEVYNACQKYMNVVNLEQQLQPGYETNLQNISTEATQNYNKRTIGLLDYIDKSRTYRDAKINLMQLQNMLLQSEQYINYVCNSTIF